MEEEQESYKDSNGIEFDFFGCLEVMELRLVKRFESIEDRLEEQNKKLSTIIEALSSNKKIDEVKVTKPKSPAPKPHTDHKYVEIPFELHNTSLIGNELTDFPETKYPSPLHSHIDYYSQTLPVSPLSQPQKKRKLENPLPEVEVIECIEIIPQNDNASNFLSLISMEHEYEEVEVEVEHIEELPKSFTHLPFQHNRGAKPFVKVNSIPPLPIDNIDILRGFNKSLATNKVMAAEFTRNLSLYCSDDKDSAPELLITSIIGPTLLVQSTWASKSSGRLRIASLMGILNCVMKAAERAPFGGFLMNFFREKVMDLLHTLRTQDRSETSAATLAIKNEKIE